MPVNRPFPAFAALLLLMTLAVVALSTSSRSTTVGPAPRRKAVLVQPPAKGGPSFVFVVAGSIANDDEDDVAELGLQPIEDEEDAAEVLGSMVSPLQSAKVCAVEPVPGIADGSFAFGVLSDSTGAMVRTASVLSAEEALTIFEQFGACKSTNSWRPGTDGHSRTVEHLYQWIRSSRIAAAARLWLVQQLRRLVEELPLFSSLSTENADHLEWSEYAELIDLAVNEQGKAEDGFIDELQRTAVRFGDWMRYSAAAPFSATLAVPGTH